MKTIVVSDFHLDTANGTTSNGAATDEALVSFLEWLTARAHTEQAPWRLIVLGDFLDLLHAPMDLSDPLVALQAVAAEHRPALAALGAAAADGIQIDLVPGNHDSELVDPDLHEQLCALVCEAAGISATRLQSNFHIRPWFLLVPGFFYAEHGSQYHSLNAVVDPLAPFGRWSRRLPPGGVLDLGLHGKSDDARARTLLRIVPAVLRAAASRWIDTAPMASLQAFAQDTGLSPGALASLRDLAEDSPIALARNLSAALRGHRNYVEARQQHAAVAVDQILKQERKAVPLYLFGHTHTVSHCALRAGGSQQLLWLNPGAWADGTYAFAELEDRSDGVVARLWQWDSSARCPRTLSDPLLCSRAVA